VYEALSAVVAAHKALPIPKQVGRQITMKKRD
jgi:hypothetical protein